jgi:hypothetical protein
MFRLANTFPNPTGGSGPQRGFPSPGAYDQQVGTPTRKDAQVPWTSEHPTKGKRTWFLPWKSDGAQRGFPSPEKPAQARPPGSMPNCPPVWGGVYQHYTPYYSRGAAAYVPNFGYVLTNPIGAGIVALHRPQPSYGPAAQYYNGAIWWVTQQVPTSIHMQGLTDPEELLALVGETNVEAMVRTTG